MFVIELVYKAELSEIDFSLMGDSIVVATAGSSSSVTPGSMASNVNFSTRSNGESRCFSSTGSLSVED